MQSEAPHDLSFVMGTDRYYVLPRFSSPCTEHNCWGCLRCAMCGLVGILD
jgi:hypothetical protein